MSHKGTKVVWGILKLRLQKKYAEEVHGFVFEQRRKTRGGKSRRNGEPWNIAKIPQGLKIVKATGCYS